MLYHLPKCVLLLTLVSIAPVFGAEQQPARVSPVVRTETLDGQFPCNASAAFAQIPGQTDMFVGRGVGIGSLEYCHCPTRRDTSFLALYQMDWNSLKMTLTKFLFQPARPPAKEPSGVWSAYDPYAASYRGEIWIAFECALPGTVGSCVAPMTQDAQSLDLSRLTVLVRGDKRGSASTPVLLNFQDHLYLYWTIDAAENRLSQNTLVSRGMELEKDPQGRLWGVGSRGHSVVTDDPRLTTLVDDVNPSDATTNHVAHLRSIFVVGSTIIAISTLGGTAGQEVCASSHQISPGCWRISLSVADAPLEENAFGRKKVILTSLPYNNGIDYPRIVVDPFRHKLLLGQFFPLKLPEPASKSPQIPTGVRYLLFDSIIAAALKSQ
jgi:hypothetical protein